MHISLTVDNSTCCLSGYSLSQYKQLIDLLSYALNSQNSYFSGYYGVQKRSLFTKRGEFPAGLLYLVEEWLVKNDLSYLREDKRIVPKIDFNFFEMKLKVTPYPEQESAAEACLENHRGIVVAPTGFGKSIIAALIINSLKVRTLLVVPTLELKRQLTESLKQYFGDDKVGNNDENLSITVENVDALDDKKVATQDCVIIDEFHHSGAKTYRKLNRTAWSKVYYKFGLTATPFRSQDNERLLLESVLSKVIYKIEHKDAVKKGYIVPIEAYYIEVPKTKTDGYTWSEVYKDLVVNNESRNALLHEILSNFHANNIPTLCLVKEIAHGEKLSELTGIPFANGESGNAKRLIDAFNSGKISCLIGTTGVLGEGIDTKPAEYIIIAGLGKSKNAFMQQVGRGFRTFPGKESCKVILFHDKSHKWTKAHFREQLRFLREEYNVMPVQLNMSRKH